MPGSSGTLRGSAHALTLVAALFGAEALAETPAGPPFGVFLLYPETPQRPSAAQCDAYVSKIRPSVAKAEDWLWGRVPMNRELEFYLFISPGRMQTTYAAEGDYDSGTVQFGPASGTVTPFKLRPEDHPDLTIEGSIEASTESPVIAVTLFELPNREGERRSFFCRFDAHSEA